jgi:hypothetical protein
MKKLENDFAAILSTWMDSAEVKEIVDRTRAASAEDTGTFRMVITTENLDRYDEVIAIDGWELDHYMRNPVVLWGHDHYTPPVAVTDQLIKEEGKLIALGRFAPTDHGQMLRKLYDLGFLSASSVGFIVKERQGNLITKSELIEWSFVSVPANPYALSLAFEKGLSINELVTKGVMTIIKDVAADGAGKEAINKGAVEDVLDAKEAREAKWKNFKQVDDVVYSFWDVYFKDETPVADFSKLLGETLDLLSQINSGKKDLTFGPGITAVKEAVQSSLRTASGALEALDIEEPERAEEELGEEAEEEALRSFNEQRRILQQASTIISDILAEKRLEAQALLKK